MIHYDAMTLDDLRSIIGDPAALDLCCHQMMGLDGEVPEAEVIEVIEQHRYGRQPLTYDTQEMREYLASQVKHYRRPVFPLCRSDVPLDRLIGLVDVVRKRTGRGITLMTDADDSGMVAYAYLNRSTDLKRKEVLTFIGQLEPQHPAHAIILACLAAGIVYRRQG